MERRKFLALFGGSGLVSLTLLGESTDYTDSEAALRELAEVVNTNIGDLQHTPQLISELKDQIGKSRTGLNSTATERERKIANFIHSIDQLLSSLPGISPPPATPPIETKITAIRTANSYYRILLDSLEASESIREDLLSVDFSIINASSESTATIDFESAITDTDTALSNLQREDNQLPRSNGNLLSQLLPDREQVLTDLSQRRKIYATHADIQESYIVASELIDEATINRENQERQVAKQKFSKAESAVELSIPKQLVEYSLGATSIPLERYQTILQAYADGLPLLEKSCQDPRESGTSPNQLFGEGLTYLFTARQEIESVSTWA